MRGGHSRGVKGVRDQERLLGIETFGAGAVETPQEQVEPMLELCDLVPGLPQDVEQLADHLLEHDGIVGQRHRGVGEGNAGGGTGCRAHTSAGGAVPHDAGNDPFDPIAPAGEGNGRARGRECRSLV